MNCTRRASIELLTDISIPLEVFDAVGAQRLSPPAAYLWLVLRGLSGPDATPDAFSPPAITSTNATLQQWAPFSHRQIARLLNELVAAGLLRKTTEAGQRQLQLCLPAVAPATASDIDVTPVATPVSPQTRASEVTVMSGVSSTSAVTPIPDTIPMSEASPMSGATPALSPTDEPLMTVAVMPVWAAPVPPVDYTRLAEVQPAPDPQREQACGLWATLSLQLPPTFADTTGLELAQSSAGLPVLIVGVPDAARARTLDAGQADTVLQAALRAAGFPVWAVRFVYWPA